MLTSRGFWLSVLTMAPPVSWPSSLRRAVAMAPPLPARPIVPEGVTRGRKPYDVALAEKCRCCARQGTIAGIHVRCSSAKLPILMGLYSCDERASASVGHTPGLGSHLMRSAGRHILRISNFEKNFVLYTIL